MNKLFHPFFVLVAHIIHSQLVEQIDYLKVENQILRSKLGKRVILTPEERNRLIRFGTPLGSPGREPPLDHQYKPRRILKTIEITTKYKRKRIKHREME